MAGVLAAAKPREFCHLTGVNFLVPHQNSDLNGFPYYAEDCTNPPWPRGNDAVFCHLPLLVFQRWDATTAVPTRESILRVYRNMRSVGPPHRLSCVCMADRVVSDTDVRPLPRQGTIPARGCRPTSPRRWRGTP